ncbi:MAG TPA: ATP-binding protein [Rhizomicrobium sp.]|nr:ATP-binding protein [Rhizomicrobium sp.]
MSAWASATTPRGTLPLVTILAATILVLAGAVTAFYEDRLYRAQEVDVVRVQGQILASGVVAALVFNDNRAAQEYANAMKANPQLEAVGIYPAEGHAVAGFVRSGDPPLPKVLHAVKPKASGGKFSVVLPVMQNREVVGFVYLRAAIEPLARRLARYVGILLLVTMAALVLFVFARAQTALSRANAELESRALALSEANDRLVVEMSERSKAEEALRQSQKMEAIGQLSGGIAHDFNNLLTIIMGNLHLLQRRLSQGRSDVDRYIHAASEGLNRAANLTQRILAFSRRQPLSPKPVNLSALVEGMSELIRHSVGDRARFELLLKSDWWVVCDANQMENVILNLVINARDAMPEGGLLTVSTENLRLVRPLPGLEEAPPGDYVRLVVADTGTGMSEEIRTKAIDPFFTTKPMGQGTGLGLSMTFGYVRQSGGYMAIDSTVGNGTAINILMPKGQDDISRGAK